MKKAKKLLLSVLLVAGVLAIPATGFAAGEAPPKGFAPLTPKLQNWEEQHPDWKGKDIQTYTPGTYS